MAIPSKLVAGDTWPLIWHTTLYREVDLYSAEMFFGLGAVKISVDGIEGDTEEDWDFTFPSSETEKCEPPGQWIYWIIVSRGTERVTPETGKVEIWPNPETDKPIEPRSIKRQTLDEALIARREVMSSPVHQASFAGNTYTLADLDKLDRAIRRLEDELAGEEGGPGGASRKLVYSKFRKI